MAIKSRPSISSQPRGRQAGKQNKIHYAAAVRYKPTGRIIVFGSKQTIRERIYEEFARARKLTWAATALRDELRKEDLRNVNFASDILPRFEIIDEVKSVDSASMLLAKDLLITKHDAKNPLKGYNGQ